MLASSVQRILASLGDDDVVLDVGGWAKPLPRADWVLDLMPYETRGLYGRLDGSEERFGPETWVQRDICEREPWPFGEGHFDFAICSHTLEDVRDPVWVCSELNRVARAGYVEVPSRLEEQCYGVHGPWVGWSHHRWLVDVAEGAIELVSKPGVLHGRADYHFPSGIAGTLTAEERVETLFWEGGFPYRERIFYEPEDLHDYLADLVAERLPSLAARLPAPSRGSRLRRLPRRLLRAIRGPR